MGVEELADLLTGGQRPGGDIVIASSGNGRRILLGCTLKGLSLGGFPHKRRKFTEKIIWRRGFLHDRYTYLPSATRLAS